MEHLFSKTELALNEESKKLKIEGRLENTTGEIMHNRLIAHEIKKKKKKQLYGQLAASLTDSDFSKASSLNYLF